MSWGMYGKRSRAVDHQLQACHPRRHQCCHLRPADTPYDSRLGYVVTYYSDDCNGNHRRYQARWPAVILMTCSVCTFCRFDIGWRRKRERKRTRTRTWKVREEMANVNWNWLMFKQLVSISTAEISIRCWPRPSHFSFFIINSMFMWHRLKLAQTEWLRGGRGGIKNRLKAIKFWVKR